MKSNHRFLRQILVISLLAVLCLIATSPVTAAPVTSLGSIYLKSTPSGATVFLDDVNKGVTSVTLNDIAAGIHAVVMKKAGYADYKTSVTVVGGKTVTVSATLTPTTGSLYLKSTPSGATVFLDDVSKGTTTVTLRNIAIGTHSVVMKKAGYTDYKTSVTVVGGKTVTVSATLKQTTGSINIKSTPSGATVLLDNVKKGVTPITLSNIKTGEHTIVLKNSKYKDYQTKVTVVADQTASVDATLSKLPQPFTLSVSPTSTSAGPGEIIPFTIQINGGEGLNEPIHLTVKATAYTYSKTYDLGYLQPPFPTTVTKSVTMPSGVPSGVTITGTITATGGGMTRKATVKIKSTA